MLGQQVDQIGGYITLREAAKRKGATTNALYLWLRDRRVPHVKVGRTIVVHPDSIEGYIPRGK